MHLSYGVCRLRARVHLKTISSLLNYVPTAVLRLDNDDDDVDTLQLHFPSTLYDSIKTVLTGII